jgi:hypothetical protein
MNPCHGSNHCHAVQCERCAWRYSGRIARRISISTGPVYASAIHIPDLLPSDVRGWRAQIRNRICYLRQSPRWHNFSLHVWLNRDGSCRGVLSAGTLDKEEVGSALSRWPVTLRAVSCDQLRLEIFDSAKPSVVCSEGPTWGRYWSRSLYIGPCRSPIRPLLGTPKDPVQDWYEPMPILL